MANMKDKKKRKSGKGREVEFIDFKALKSAKGLIADISEDDDAFDKPPVPQPIVYQVKIDWQEKDEGVVERKYKLDEDGDPTDELLGYRCWVTATIMKGEFKGTKVMGWLNTYAQRGRKTNQVHTLLTKAGVKVKKKATQEQLIIALRDAINQGLITWLKIGWRGSYKNEEGKYENVIQNENGFPQEDGVFSPHAEVKHKGKWITIDAQTQWDKVYAENPDLEGDEDDDDDEDDDNIPKGKKSKKSVKNVVDDDEDGEDDDDEDEDDDEDDTDDDDDTEDEEDEDEAPQVKVKKGTKKSKVQVNKKKSKKVVEDDDEDDED